MVTSVEDRLGVTKDREEEFGNVLAHCRAEILGRQNNIFADGYKLVKFELFSKHNINRLGRGRQHFELFLKPFMDRIG